MNEKQIVCVEYKPATFGSDQSEWKDFFTGPGALLLHGAPIQKVGPNKYAFLHKEILDYFSVQAGLGQMGIE